jgi:hypothetical protein
MTSYRVSDASGSAHIATGWGTAAGTGVPRRSDTQISVPEPVISRKLR